METAPRLCPTAFRPAAHVQNHHHLARLGAAQEFFAADLLHALVIVGAEVLGPGDVELGEMRGGDVAQLCVEAGDVRVGRRSPMIGSRADR
jgi:hypothetical protein